MGKSRVWTSTSSPPDASGEYFCRCAGDGRAWRADFDKKTGRWSIKGHEIVFGQRSEPLDFWSKE